MKNLILFGFQGCGKTFFGKKLSRELSLPFYDLDALIVDLYTEKTGRLLTLRSLYRQEGEKAFRALEQEALFRLKDTSRSVIALGGGTVLDPKNVALLSSLGTLVYLKASAARLRKQILSGELPAFLETKDPEGSLDRILSERLPLYEKIRAHALDTDLLDEAGVLSQLRFLFLEEVDA